MEWPLFFFACTLVLFLIPLAPALIEWYWRSDDQPLQVVRAYDGNIRYFALRFRQMIDDNLPSLTQGKVSEDMPARGKFGRDVYQLVTPTNMPTFGPLEELTKTTNQMILGTGSLQLPEGFFFEKEIYAFGHIAGGPHSSYRVLLAEDEISLADDCDVVRWAHSSTSISVGRMNRLYGRISAEKQISLACDTRFVRMHAPSIYFGDVLDAHSTDTTHPSMATIQFSAPETLLDSTKERWLISGDLNIQPRTSHTGSLVVEGNFCIAEDSFIQGSLKSGANLQLTRNVHVLGALVADGDIHIGPNCYIAGPIVSEGKITIAAGTCIGTLDQPTTIAAHEISIEEGVLAHGSVWARELGFVAQRQH